MAKQYERTPYQQKLLDPRWQKKRLTILNRDKWACKYCKDTDSTLHVHHLKYTGEPWEAPDSDLVSCCEDCHFIIEDLKDLEVLSIRKRVKKDILLFTVFWWNEQYKYSMSLYDKSDNKISHAVSISGHALSSYVKNLKSIQTKFKSKYPI